MTISLKTGKHFFALIVACSLLSACGRQPEVSVPIDPVITADIADVRSVPQSLDFFAEKYGSSTTLLTQEEAAEQDARFNRIFFAPWKGGKINKSNKDYFQGELNRKGAKRGVAENLRPWTEERWQAMVDNAQLQAFPNMDDAAITTRATSLRAAPTLRPRLVHPTDPGQTFPFDEFQHSSVPVGMSIKIVHTSFDRAWFLVESPIAAGWIAAQDVAFVDAAFQKQWENGNYAAIVQDFVPLYDPTLASAISHSYAHIGTILPIDPASFQPTLPSGVFRLFVPVRNTKGYGEIAAVSVNFSQAIVKPLPLTLATLSLIGDRLMGEAYGWGGLWEDRDCSSTLQDLFAPFGLWLPRNSASQAKVGTYIDFSKSSPGEKEQQILSQAKPFATLIYQPGHIGLYVGEHKGRAVFFHNIWGIRTLAPSPGQPSGRHVVGQAVITTLEPGKELPNVDPKTLILNRIQGMTRLVP